MIVPKVHKIYVHYGVQYFRCLNGVVRTAHCAIWNHVENDIGGNQTKFLKNMLNLILVWEEWNIEVI